MRWVQLGDGDGVLFNYESERHYKMALDWYHSSYARGDSLTDACIRLFRLPLVFAKIQVR